MSHTIIHVNIQVDRYVWKYVQIYYVYVESCKRSLSRFECNCVRKESCNVFPFVDNVLIFYIFRLTRKEKKMLLYNRNASRYARKTKKKKKKNVPMKTIYAQNVTWGHWHMGQSSQCFIGRYIYQLIETYQAKRFNR